MSRKEKPHCSHSGYKQSKIKMAHRSSAQRQSRESTLNRDIIISGNVLMVFVSFILICCIALAIDRLNLQHSALWFAPLIGANTAVFGIFSLKNASVISADVPKGSMLFGIPIYLCQLCRAYIAVGVCRFILWFTSVFLIGAVAAELHPISTILKPIFFSASENSSVDSTVVTEEVSEKNLPEIPKESHDKSSSETNSTQNELSSVDMEKAQPSNIYTIFEDMQVSAPSLDILPAEELRAYIIPSNQTEQQLKQLFWERIQPVVPADISNNIRSLEDSNYQTDIDTRVAMLSEMEKYIRTTSDLEEIIQGRSKLFQEGAYPKVLSKLISNGYYALAKAYIDINGSKNTILNYLLLSEKWRYLHLQYTEDPDERKKDYQDLFLRNQEILDLQLVNNSEQNCLAQINRLLEELKEYT